MGEEEIRRERLAWLRDNKFGGRAKDLADRIGVSPAQLGQWLSSPNKRTHRAISPDSARRIETACRMPKYWLDGAVKGSAPELSPMAQRLGRAFDEISEEKQSEVFVQILERLESAATAPVPDAGQPAPQPKTKRASHK